MSALVVFNSLVPYNSSSAGPHFLVTVSLSTSRYPSLHKRYGFMKQLLTFLTWWTMNTIPLSPVSFFWLYVLITRRLPVLSGVKCVSAEICLLHGHYIYHICLIRGRGY